MSETMTRRDLMKGLGVAALVAGAGAMILPAGAASEKDATKPASRECQLPALPYPYDALEPVIDKETLTIHHDKHHAAYVNNFNNAMKKLAEARTSGDYSLIKHWSRELAFNGSGHVLHTLYWENMAPAPNGGGQPKGDLLRAMDMSFGGFDQFKAQFVAATNAVEGSGWGILAHEPFRGHLVILQAEKHQDLTIWGVYPIMVCDVWEHAYYLKYQNRRPEYVENFFKIINWPAVEKKYKAVKDVAAYK
ncbi:MAG: superoxide dismutase [Deltaproteobacteria bacterium]|nr:superoxide dismutase [Deltaproteobacteria bacterium]